MDKLNNILPYIRERKCALFIGAGLSIMAGCYDWDSIVKEMLDHPLIKKGIDKKDLLGKVRNDELIEYCQQLFIEGNEERQFWGIARRAINFKPELFNEHYLPLIKTLKQIQPNLEVLLTTNIDNCLEHTNEFDLSKIYFKVEDFTKERLDGSGIFHIHGFIEDFEKSLLTRNKYIPRYREKEFQSFLKSFFAKYSVLFLGYSLRDQEIKDVILETKNEKKHFLLIPEEEGLTPSQVSFYYDMYRIVTIEYGRRENLAGVFGEWIEKNFKVTSLEIREVDKPNV
jgi:NAD-dependent SIR2 family protein deacetylase